MSMEFLQCAIETDGDRSGPKASIESKYCHRASSFRLFLSRSRRDAIESVIRDVYARQR